MIADQLCAFQCQPRFGSSQSDGLLNNAGELLDDLSSFVHQMEEAAVAAATRKDCSTEPGAAEWKGWCILGHHAANTDDLAGFSAHAAAAARDQAHAAIQRNATRAA